MNELMEIGGVENEEDWTEDGTLWYTAGDRNYRRVRGREMDGVFAVGDKRREPLKNSTSEAKGCFESTFEDSVVDGVKGGSQI